MRTSNNKNQVWNFPKMVFKVFLVFICIIFIQYCYVSLFPSVYGINMDEFALNRNTYSTTLYANRGTIYDVDGNALAQNVASYTVIAYLEPSRTIDENNPKHVIDPNTTAEKLSPILNMTKETLYNLLTTKGVYQVELGPGGRGITELKKEEIEDLNLPGIDFDETSKRYYPNGDFASYIIGYAKQNETYKEENGKNTIIKTIDGELGIEYKYDSILKGTNGYLSYQQDKYGYKIPDTVEERIDAQNGKDIYLTIDSNIQRFVESSIKEATDKYSPEWMLIEVMDAKTGDILASSSTPSFDPNIKDIKNYENPLVSFVFEPGSTMKTYTYMCAIEKGTYRGNDTFLSGGIEVGEYIISDWNQVGWGTINYDLGYEYSSNVAITNIVQKFIDKNDLKNCFIKYGFGELTEIDLPRELVGSLNFNYPIEVATAGFGQGIFTTPIQHLQALSIIANNGKMVKPNIISKIFNPNTKEVEYERRINYSEQLVSETTISKMRDLMWNTVNNDNIGTTGSGYYIDGFDVIGKTGTAQIYDNENKRYFTGWNDYIYSFSGMFPKDDPEIIIYAAIKRPNNGSSSSLNNAVRSVIKSIAKYKNIYKDNLEEDYLEQFVMPSYRSKNTENVQNELNSKGIKTFILGNGQKIINQYPKPGVTVLENDKVFLITNDSNYLIPNMIGWSRNDVVNLLNLISCDYKITGNGYVASQSLKANSNINNDTVINIVLEDKNIFDLEKKDDTIE